MNSTLTRAAYAYMDRGWPVFPVKGKTPLTTNGVLDATTDTDTIAAWPKETTGLGLATGKPSGVWVLDLDSDDAMRTFLTMQDEHSRERVRTVACKTMRGYHLYFRMPPIDDIRNSAGQIGEGIDVRGTGGYVVLPPSAHPDGGTYEWVKSRALDDLPIAPPISFLFPKTNGTRTPAPEMGDVIGEGGRNATLASLAGSLRRRNASEAAILAALTVENETRCVPPLSAREVEQIAASVARYAPAEQPPAPPGVNDAPAMQLTDVAVLDAARDEKLLPVSAVPTPWASWNKVCRGAGGGVGLAHGWHVIVGAPSGSGKSLFATNFAANAIRHGEHVCLISLEMSQVENITRLLAIYTGTEIRRLEHGSHFSPEAWDDAGMRLMEASGSIRINRHPINGLDQIRAVFERHVADGCRTFITDYLQLAWVRDAETLRQQITEVSHTIRGLAQEHKVLSVGLSQLNRAASTSSSEFKKEGLMGGSSLENDADQVVLLSRPVQKYTTFESHVVLDKNRHGPSLEWDLTLDTTTLRMT